MVKYLNVISKSVYIKPNQIVILKNINGPHIILEMVKYLNVIIMSVLIIPK